MKSALKTSTAFTRPRGLIAMRNDGGNVVELVTKLNSAFEEFKAANDSRLKDIEKKGAADTVTVEKVDRINADITKISTELQAVMTRMAALPAAANDDKEAKASLGRWNLTLRAHAKGLGREKPAAMNAAGFEAYRNAFNDALRLDNRTLPAEVMNALQIGSDPDGGYLCPPEVDSTIDRIVTSMGAMRSLATIRQIGGASYKKPVTTTGAGFGGWAEETEAPTETTTPKLSELEFTARKMWAEPRATSDMLEDASVNVEAWLGDEVGLTLAANESEAFITGNGVKRPRGLLGYPIVANGSYSWGNIGYVASGGTSDFASSNPSDKLFDLVHALKRQYRGNATWMMNDTTLGKIRKFKDGQGNYLWQPGLQAGMVGVLLGHPVATDDFMPDVTTDTYPIAFGDFRRGYVVVDRRGTIVIRDNLTSKPYVKFYTTRRVGGGIQNFEAIKVMKIANS